MKSAINIVVAILILSSTGAWAVEKAPRITDREIVERLTRLEEGQKALAKRIDDLDAKLSKRIDDVNKRIDDLDAKLSKRIDDVNKRIDDLDAKLSKRIDDTNRRIDDLRSEMNSRFDTLQWMLGLFITISLVILGFVLRMQWQMNKKQTALEATLQVQKDELNFLKSLIEKLLPPKGVL